MWNLYDDHPPRRLRGQKEATMTIKEKIAYLEHYISTHYGEGLAEWLWEQTNNCTTDKELAVLVDRCL